MPVAAQTVTIVNNSGKIVKSTKQFVNLFNEAKAAYNERKAELKAHREAEDAKVRPVHRQLEALALADNDDARSRTSSRRRSEDGPVRRKPVPSHGQSRHHSHQPRVQIERRVSDSFYAGDGPSERRHGHNPSPLHHEAADDDEPRIKELTRRHTDLELMPQRRHQPSRRASADHIDMDLAYGEMPPTLPPRRHDDEIELRTKMTGLQRLLEEANCVQHSVSATIENLQKNPEALAAVGLALGEISNIAMKMAPGALTAMKGSFPAIVAILASPQFAIAAGVGVGVTIIALGGYKIIKKIQANKAEQAKLLEGEPPLAAAGAPMPQMIEEAEPGEVMDELREINHIERWRRGIADCEAESLGTSVDGEFITPHATRTLVAEGRLTEADLKPPASTTSGRSHRRRHHAKSTTTSNSKAKSTVSSKSKSKTSSARPAAKKEPSGLKMLFMGRSS